MATNNPVLAERSRPRELLVVGLVQLGIEVLEAHGVVGVWDRGVVGHVAIGLAGSSPRTESQPAGRGAGIPKKARPEPDGEDNRELARLMPSDVELVHFGADFVTCYREPSDAEASEMKRRFDEAPF